MRNDKIFYCPTNDYVKTFLNSKILQEHISMGKHVHNLKGIDQVKQIRIHHITNSDFNKFNDNDSIISNKSDNSFPMGWALPPKTLYQIQFPSTKIHI